MKDIGKRLRELRLEKQADVGQLAEAISISPEDYGLLETGEQELSAQQLLALCAFYRVGLDAFDALKPKKKKSAAPKNPPRPRYYSETKDPEEAEEAMLQLISEIIVKTVLKETADHDRLKDDPKGFHPDHQITCGICGQSVSGNDAWFDPLGYKCLICHTAEKDQQIPPGLALDQDLFYTERDFRWHLEMEPKLLKDLIKAAYLKERIIHHHGKPYFRLFLMAENADFLPPKDVLKSDWMTVTDANREPQEVSMAWYYFEDRVAAFQRYGISEFIEVHRKHPQS